MATVRSKSEIRVFKMNPGDNPVIVLEFNTNSLNYAEMKISGNVLKMSDDCSGGILLTNGQMYIVQGSDYSRSGSDGEHIAIRMKCADNNPAAVTVHKSYRTVVVM